MKKFTITLTLTDQDAERIASLWDKIDFPGIMKKALEDYYIDRYDAEQFIFKKWGMAILVDEKYKDKVQGTRLQYQAAKLLSTAKVEEEISEEDE